MGEGRPIGNRLFQELFFLKNSEFRKRTHSLSMGKGKTEIPFFPGNPTITLLVNLSAFRPDLLRGGWVWIMRFCLG